MISTNRLRKISKKSLVYSTLDGVISDYLLIGKIGASFPYYFFAQCSISKNSFNLFRILQTHQNVLPISIFLADPKSKNIYA
jgi:hypothetical protein